MAHSSSRVPARRACLHPGAGGHAEGDESRVALVDNLAASIYKQGELANEAKDYRAAADTSFRIRTASAYVSIRATAEYDAGAALLGYRTGSSGGCA